MIPLLFLLRQQDHHKLVHHTAGHKVVLHPRHLDETDFHPFEMDDDPYDVMALQYEMILVSFDMTGVWNDLPMNYN